MMQGQKNIKKSDCKVKRYFRYRKCK